MSTPIAIRINERKEAEAGGQSDGNQGMTREEAYEHIGVEPGKADASRPSPTRYQPAMIPTSRSTAMPMRQQLAVWFFRT